MTLLPDAVSVLFTMTTAVPFVAVAVRLSVPLLALRLLLLAKDRPAELLLLDVAVPVMVTAPEVLVLPSKAIAAAVLDPPTVAFRLMPPPASAKVTLPVR